MSDLHFKRMVYFLVLCTTLFPSSYYNVLSWHMILVDDIENFEKYLWVIDAYEELLRQLYEKRNLIAMRESIAEFWEEIKDKLV